MARKSKYGAIKSKKAYPKKVLVETTPVDADSSMSISCDKVADVALDIWRIGQRAKADSTNERIVAAWERAEDRICRLGFKLDTMQDRPYDENLRVRVVEHEAGAGVRTIAECLTPAVFYNGVLIREAEVVTRGGE
jgi:hypothetical protein